MAKYLHTYIPSLVTGCRPNRLSTAQQRTSDEGASPLDAWRIHSPEREREREREKEGEK